MTEYQEKAIEKIAEAEAAMHEANSFMIKIGALPFPEEHANDAKLWGRYMRKQLAVLPPPYGEYVKPEPQTDETPATLTPISAPATQVPSSIASDALTPPTSGQGGPDVPADPTKQGEPVHTSAEEDPTLKDVAHLTVGDAQN